MINSLKKKKLKLIYKEEFVSALTELRKTRREYKSLKEETKNLENDLQ